MLGSAQQNRPADRATKSGLEDQRPGAPGATGARPLESGEGSHPRPSQCMEVLIACNQYVIRGSLVHWDGIDPEENMKMIENA